MMIKIIILQGLKHRRLLLFFKILSRARATRSSRHPGKTSVRTLMLTFIPRKSSTLL